MVSPQSHCQGCIASLAEKHYVHPVIKDCLGCGIRLLSNQFYCEGCRNIRRPDFLLPPPPPIRKQFLAYHHRNTDKYRFNSCLKNKLQRLKDPAINLERPPILPLDPAIILQSPPIINLSENDNRYIKRVMQY